MKFSFKTGSRKVALLSILAALMDLSGCALAPGVTMSAGNPAQSSMGIPLPQWLRAYEPVPDGQGRYASLPTQPTPVFLPITRDLIRVQHAQAASEVSQDLKSLFGTAKPYTIGPGDILNIAVWDHPELTLAPSAGNSVTDAASLSSVGNGYNVSAEGFVQFPYVGNLKLSGLTETQAREELTAKLGKYLKNPQLTLRIQAYRSGRVFVEGDVRTPGVQAINDIPLSLTEAIGRAGGFLPTADQSTVNVIRAGKATLVNLPELTKIGVSASRILLAGGDIVQVLNRDEAKIYVLGEVVKPATIPLRNGMLTLSDALGEAGGVNQLSGDPRQVYVLRNGGSGNAEIYHLDARSPAAYALAQGFDLKAHDVVFVDPTSLVRYNRVLNLLLPSVQGVVTGTQLGK